MTANLTGKKVLITAAAQGIGQASALAFARAGATVHATDINAEALAKMAEEPGIKTHILNVLEADAVSKLVSEIGDIDVLFNCAGVVHGGSVLEMKDSDLEFAFDLNVKAMIRTIRAFLPRMIANGGASIINMSSVCSSIKAVPNRFAYGATKAAVIGLTKSVAADFVPRAFAATPSAPAPSRARRCCSVCATPATSTRPTAEFTARQAMGRFGRPDGTGRSGRLPGVGRVRLHHRHRQRDRRRLGQLIRRKE
jgi:2-keto-3-deoxy-L-fuconate dehydrogenase